MKRGKLPGVATASKRLADGTRRKYYYAWRGGPLLKAEEGTPLAPNDPQFVVAYAAAHAERRKPAVGTMFSLIAAFKASSEFTTLSEKTKKDYRRYLKLIEEEFGTMPLAAIEHRKARGEFKTWRDTMADRPRVADYAWTTLARVLSVAQITVGMREVRERRRSWRNVIVAVGRSEVVLLEPFGLDEVAGQRDRLLLILRRKEQLAHALSQVLEVFQRFTSGRPIAGSLVLFVVNSIPDSMSIPAARELVGQPHLSDHLLFNELSKRDGGPVHLIVCHKSVSESQAVRMLGFPNATVVSAPFGIYVVDPIQSVQLVLISQCRDEMSTRHGVHRFLEWLDESEQSTELVKHARRRKAIVAVLAK